MNKQLVCVAIFIVVLMASRNVCCSSVNIEVTTHYNDDPIPNAFNIRCTVPARGSCAMVINSIQVTKDDEKIIANIQRDNTIFYNRLLQSSVKAEGHIDSNASRTFLSVTVLEAVKDDSGLYTCRLQYLDESLRHKLVSTSKNVTITSQDTQDIIKHLMSKISFLENVVKFQQDELSNFKMASLGQGTDLEQKLIRMENEMAAKFEEQKNESTARLEEHSRMHFVKLEEQKTHFNSKIDQLNNYIEIQEEDLKQLNNKENTTVSFKALLGQGSVFQDGKDLVYDRVISNEGGGYDSTTGIFTVPVAGYYLLHVSIGAGKTDDSIYLDLRTSDGQVLARLRSGDKGFYDYAGTSCVARLEAGERVRPVITEVYSDFSINQHYSLGMNTFYGFLLNTLK